MFDSSIFFAKYAGPGKVMGNSSGSMCFTISRDTQASPAVAILKCGFFFNRRERERERGGGGGVSGCFTILRYIQCHFGRC